MLITWAILALKIVFNTFSILSLFGVVMTLESMFRNSINLLVDVSNLGHVGLLDDDTGLLGFLQFQKCACVWILQNSN